MNQFQPRSSSTSSAKTSIYNKNYNVSKSTANLELSKKNKTNKQ